MRGFRLVPIVLVGVALVAPGTAIASDTDVQAAEQVWSEDATAIREATLFRESFGLRADSAFIRETIDDATRYSSEAFGVPLSESEVAEMFRRARIQTAMDEVFAMARQHPGFAGAWLDQQHGGRPVLMFTKPDLSLQPEFERVLPSGADLQIAAAVRTEEDLSRLKRQIGGDRELWASHGIDIVRVAVWTSENTVRVGVLKFNIEAEAALQARYGAHVRVYETVIPNSDVCDAWNDCRPIKGGIAINASGGSAGQCTAGFVVERTDNSALALLTAGHCIQANGTFDSAWQHNASGFGRALRETWEPGGQGEADVGLISIQSPEVALMTSKNLMRRTNGSVASVTSYLLNPLQGGQACRVGKSGHKCGIITFPDVEHISPVPGVGTMDVLSTAEVSAPDAIGGDSGGPMFYYPGGGTCCSPVRALGTHVHSESSTTNVNWFSPYWVGRADYDAIPDTQAAYTYNICLSASC